MIKIIIAITGPSCAGKTSACDFFKEKGCTQIIHASSIVRKRYEMEKVNTPMLDFVKNEYKKKGKRTFAKDFLSYAEKLNKNNHIIIEGIRSVEELLIFKKNFSDVYCLGIFADTKTRFERNKIRNQRDNITDYSQFLRKDFTEYSFGISTLMAEYCDKMIINENSVQMFHSKINEEIREYLTIF